MSAPAAVIPRCLSERSSESGYWLTQAMARSAGVSISSALATDRLSPGGFAEMVARCGACSKTDCCLLHLADPRSEDVPGYCLNHETIAALSVSPARPGAR